MKCICEKLVLFLSLIVLVTVLPNKADPVPDLIYDDTKFMFFSHSPSIDWSAAQSNCEGWGGNLATITSYKEDIMLQQLTNIQDYFSCWIGLNDMGTEAGSDSSLFTWQDGSTSTYRNLVMFPSNTESRDCVAFRYLMPDGMISTGWQNLDCNLLTNCSYCTKPDNSRGCDLIYNGKCYRAFEVSDGINWLGAQSSCAVWGGDLTSIDSVRDIALLIWYIPDSVGECWIGLHDRDGDGTFQWVDGTPVNYYRWDTGEPGIATANECVELISANSRHWKSISCDATKNSFLCETDISNITTPGYRFGELIDGGLNFRLLTGGVFIFESPTLACKGEVNPSVIKWLYSVKADLSSSENITATYVSTETGVSWLEVDNSKQGYYQCQIDSTSINTVGIYDTQKTKVAVSGGTYTYIERVDRQDVLLLCDPMDSSVTLSNLRWNVSNGPSFVNPINIYSQRDALTEQPTALDCNSGGIQYTSITISVLAPVLTIRYSSIVSETFSSVYPAENSITVPISTRDITLSINIDGKWNLPDNSNSFNSELTIAIVSTANAELYKFYINNWDGEELIAMQLRIHLTNPDITADNELTFGNSTYGYITTISPISWLKSQLNCNNWGGNLATIESKQIDSLLYYLTTVSCWIGLNDITTEAGTDASAFVWVDGSTSTYRQFATITNGMGTEPSGGTNRDCVDFRFGNDGSSDGWDDRECNAHVFCYFCQKSGDSKGCDLIYGGSCYRAFEVSDGINWLDAQSSCAVWGGDLTSITTERENNLLYTAISDTVSNCWIGLYERDGDGMYQWVDGTVLSYTNWTGTAPTPDSTHDCVQMNTNGAGSWIAADCEVTSNCFVCKKPSLSTVITGFVFGEITDGGLNFRTIATDTFLYTSTILICKGDTSSAPIVWHYSINADLSSSVEQTATYMSTETGVSWLSVDNTKQGYYQCQIDNTKMYIVGIYDTQEITVAASGVAYSYTFGIDSKDIQLLCDPQNSNYKLSSLRWRLEDETTYTNPINISDLSASLMSRALSCISMGNNGVIASNNITINVPEITVSYKSMDTLKYTAPYPAHNIVNLVNTTQDLLISETALGKWKLPNDTYVTSSILFFPTLNDDIYGLYQFYIINWNGMEVCSIQIYLRQGYYNTNAPSITTATSGSVQNDSTIVLMNESITLSCGISNPSDTVQWNYRSYRDNEVIDKTSFSTFHAQNGVSSLVVSPDQTGFYSCEINASTLYTVYIVNMASTIDIQTFDSPTQQVNYTAGDIGKMLYYSNANIPDISLRWTTDTVTDGADTQYSIEYPNPVLLSRVFSDVGGGVHTLSCFYRMSPVTLLGSLMLIIRDTATISISYLGYNNTLSDANNPNFPSPQPLTIPEGTQNVAFSCNQIQCEWLLQDKDGSTTSDSPSYIIPIFRAENVGNYSLLRAIGETEGKYSTAHVYVHLQQIASVQSSTSFLIPIIIIIIIIIIIVIIGVIATIIIAITFIVKKRLKYPERTMIGKHKKHSSVTSREGNTGYANLADLQSPTKEYIELPYNPSGTEYMTIDETNLIPFEIKTDNQVTTGPYYSNLANLPSNEDNYEMIRENQDCVQRKTSQSYEHYTPMSNVKVEKKFVSKYIPAREFPATYQQYIASGVGDDSLLSVEFRALNEEWKGKIESSDVARKHHNVSKNPIKNILPYDENRVVLESPYFECNYINASWLENSQFIASIHPTQNTLQDFLQMIYQTEASMVIMLSTRKEKAKILGGVSNRVCYWPKKDNPLTCVPFETSLISSSETTAFVKQEISLKHTLEGKSHSFTHCISPIWNEDGTVIDVNSVIILLNRVIKQKQDYPLKPIIIHCEDGISKTGVFLTVLNVIKELNLQKSINIFNTVQNLRKQRLRIVPTMACYSTCYSLMNEYCSILL